MRRESRSASSPSFGSQTARFPALNSAAATQTAHRKDDSAQDRQRTTAKNPSRIASRSIAERSLRASIYEESRKEAKATGDDPGEGEALRE